MTGILDVNADHIEGIGVDGTVIEPAQLTAEIDVVFLDFNFAGKRHNGASFLRQFRQFSDALVMGMSSDTSMNHMLTSIGATLAMQKTRLKGALLN
jgi:hypothetical protein